jgi:double-stranded uracil-DNA glycosylase
MVRRTTATAAELEDEELRKGGVTLRKKVRRYEPEVLAVLGVSAFRIAFGDRKASVGPRLETIGRTRLWVLPNPSGLNAHYQMPQLVDRFGELRAAVEP